MSNEEKFAVIQELLKDSDILKVLEVADVNHKPHPYTVGVAHLNYIHETSPYSVSKLLTKEAIEEGEKKGLRCAYGNCSLKMSEHTHETVCFLQLKRNGTNEEVKKPMKDIVAKFGELFLDGFAMVDTPEKFRIHD